MLKNLKKKQRLQARTDLLALSDKHRSTADDIIAETLENWLVSHEEGGGPALAFGLYVGTGHEMRTHTIDAVLRKLGHKRCYPKVEGQHIVFYVIPQDCRALDMPIGSFGIPEPLGTWKKANLASMDLIFTPAILVSLGGFRLGQGGGFYDRLIGQAQTLERRPPFVALLMEEQVVPEVPYDSSFDRKVDGIMTQKRSHWIEPNPSFYRHPTNNLLAPKPQH